MNCDLLVLLLTYFITQSGRNLVNLMSKNPLTPAHGLSLVIFRFKYIGEGFALALLFFVSVSGEE